MQEIPNTIVKINGIPLADLLKYGSKAAIAKKHRVEASYITQILKGEKSNDSILLDLVSAALDTQKAKQPQNEELQEKLAQLTKLVAPVRQPA